MPSPARLARLLMENPALGELVVAVVNGRPVTLREAVEMLYDPATRPVVEAALRSLGLDDPWILAEAYYERLARAHPGMVIYGLGGLALTVEEALEHIRRRDALGWILVQQYAGILRSLGEAA